MTYFSKDIFCTNLISNLDSDFSIIHSTPYNHII